MIFNEKQNRFSKKVNKVLDYQQILSVLSDNQLVRLILWFGFDFDYISKKKMAKANSNYVNVLRDVDQSRIKITEKMNDILLPPLFKANSANEAIEVQNLIKTSCLNFSKISISTLKHLNCSKLDSLRYNREAHLQNNHKTLVRPWAAKNRKFTKENKPQISKISSKEPSQLIKTRKLSKKQRNEGNSLNLAQYASEPAKKYLMIEQNKVNDGYLTEREGRFNVRDRMNSCRVATKKIGFPFSKKQYENLKISEHFDREQEKLSTIQSNLQEQHQKFISFDSYTQLVF